VTSNVFSLIAGIGIGAAAMYVMDPEVGERRRALAREKMHVVRRRMPSRSGARDLGRRGDGIMAQARWRVLEGDVSDEVLEGRVRSKLGFFVRHPSAITTHAANRRVVLSGPIMSDEVQQLIRGIRAVRGVTDVENRLTVHDGDAQLPEVEGDKPTPADQVSNTMRRPWWLSSRFLAGTAGAVSLGLIAYSLNDGLQPHQKRPEKRPRRTLIPKLHGLSNSSANRFGA